MIKYPTLTNFTATISRLQGTVDIEGNVVRNFIALSPTFLCGFGVPRPSEQGFAGAASQLVEAAVSTKANPDIRVGDKLNVNGRDWAVIGVINQIVTRRILLAEWNAR